MKGTRSSLGSTELSHVGLCDRLHWLSDIEEYVPIIDKEARLLGTLIHVLLKYWYGQFLVSGLPAWFTAEGQYDALHREGQGHPDLIARAIQVYAKYIQDWGDVDRAWKVISVEEEQEVRVGDMFGIYSNMSEQEQTERATYYGLFEDGIGATLADLNTIVTKQADLIVEREDGVQFEIDYKSTAGLYGRLTKWTQRNRYKHAWQQMYYRYLSNHVRNPDGTLKYPRMAKIMIQRIQSIEPYASDRNWIDIPQHAFQEMPYVVARQVARRRRIRAEVARRPGFVPLGSPWACFAGGAACDGYEYCVSENREATLMSAYKKRSEQ